MVAEPMAAAIGVGLPVENSDGQHGDRHRRRQRRRSRSSRCPASSATRRSAPAAPSSDTSIVQFMRKNYILLIGEPYGGADQDSTSARRRPSATSARWKWKGRDLVSASRRPCALHSSEIREAIQEPIQADRRCGAPRAGDQRPPELASDIVDRGHRQTGAALIRGLDLLLSQETSFCPLPSTRPADVCVVSRHRPDS